MVPINDPFDIEVKREKMGRFIYGSNLRNPIGITLDNRTDSNSTDFNAVSSGIRVKQNRRHIRGDSMILTFH